MRVGRKATGLAGETPRLPRFSMMLALDSRAAEVSSRLSFYLVASRLENNHFLLDRIVCGGFQEVPILAPRVFTFGGISILIPN